MKRRWAARGSTAGVIIVIVADPPLSSPDVPDASDAELLDAAAAGDIDSFARLYDSVAPAVYGLVTSLVADRDRADATMTEIFVTAWRHAPQLAADGTAFGSWIRRLAVSRCGGVIV